MAADEAATEIEGRTEEMMVTNGSKGNETPNGVFAMTRTATALYALTAAHRTTMMTTPTEATTVTTVTALLGAEDVSKMEAGDGTGDAALMFLRYGSRN